MSFDLRLILFLFVLVHILVQRSFQITNTHTHANQTVLYCIEMVHSTSKLYIYYYSLTHKPMFGHTWASKFLSNGMYTHSYTSLTIICNCWFFPCYCCRGTWMDFQEEEGEKKSGKMQFQVVEKIVIRKVLYIRVYLACGVEKAKRSFIRFTVVQTLNSNQLSATKRHIVLPS